MTSITQASPSTVRGLYVMVGALLLAMGFIYYKAFWPVTVITVRQHPLPILYSAGDPYTGRSMAYVLDACKTNDATVTVIRELRDVADDHIVSLPQAGYSLERGCDQREIVEPMPAYVPPGRYRLRLTFTYRVGVYRNDPETFLSQEFDVK